MTPPFLFSSPGTQSKHHTNTASMLLPASGGDTESTSTFCSCYAPVTVLNSKNSESKGATVFMKDHANGQRAPPEANRPPPPSPPPLPPPLKSNLKKPITVGEPQQHQQQVMVRDGRRKVSWPDAHGRDLAHVQVFHSSVLEEGEFAMTGKSCICSIQ